MTAKNKPYEAACHVVDPDTVIVQGMEFRRELTCEMKPVSYETSRCSECGAVVSHMIQGVILNQTEDEYDVNYCPNCGARVVG